MFDDRNHKVDLLAVILSLIAVFMAMVLFSYSPTDPVGEAIFPFNRLYQPDQTVFPTAETPTNWCGHIGAFLAEMLFRLLGWGAYYLLFSLVFVAVVLFRGIEITAPAIRIFGWLISLVGFTSLASTLLVGSWSGPVIGPGGFLGAVGQGILNLYFAKIGGLFLSTGLLLIGIVLCTDYFVFKMAVLVGNTTIVRARQRKRPRRTNEVDVEAAEAEPAMSVRIGGRRVDTYLDDEDELDDEEYDEAEADEYEDDEVDEGYEDDELGEEDEQDGEEPADAESPVAGGLRRLIGRAAPALRLNKGDESQERQEVIAQLEEASRKEEVRDYDLPSIELLQSGDEVSLDQQEKEVRRKARILEKTFRDFGYQVKVVEIETGPVIAQYEVELEAGLRLSKITGLADDVAIALRVPSVRIVAPIPGKNTVGIEVPNEERQVVRLREVMEESQARIKKMRIPLFLGKDVSGNALTVDLSTLPHLLIAGRTGTGKSVCLNAIISSILMTRRPDEVRMLMIDPKMVELSGYKTLPHLMHPVVTDMRKAEAILAWAVDKMEERYELLARAGVRHVSVYNQLGEEELMERLQPQDDDERASIPLHLPFIVIVADEMADLMMTAGKEVEQHIIRLAQKSRAVGIHLILATQKPTVDVITGLIKSNLPARIAFQVASRIDSRVVLDEMGADKLLGNGDMLFLWPGTSTLLRGQGTYLSDEEINAIVECVSTGEQNFVHELVQLKVEEPGGETSGGQISKRDDLYEGAVEVVIREGRGSVSLLQRCLGIGYGRAARLIDFMAEDGIVGPYNGSQAREVVMTMSEWHQLLGNSSAETIDVEPEPAPPPTKKAKKRPETERVWPETDEEGEALASPPANSKKRVVRIHDEPEEDEEEDELLDDSCDVDEDEYEDEDAEEEDSDDEEADDSDDECEEEYEEVDEYEGEEYDPEEYEYVESDEEDEEDEEEYEDEAEDYEHDDSVQPRTG